MAPLLTILSWNSNSIRAHGEELEKFVINLYPQPDLICLQETFLKSTIPYTVQGYNIVRNDRIDRNCGGVAKLIKEGISYAELESRRGNIEYITVEISTPNKKLRISNIYCPPEKTHKVHELQRFLTDRNVLLVGDFNAHHSIFGSGSTNARGRILENLITYEFTVLNTGANTYVNHSGEESPLDLAIASKSLATICNWEVIRDPLGSDHFPTLTKVGESAISEDNTEPKWAYKRADWVRFKDKCHALLNGNEFLSNKHKIHPSYTTNL